MDFVAEGWEQCHRFIDVGGNDPMEMAGIGISSFVPTCGFATRGEANAQWVRQAIEWFRVSP